MFRTILCFFLSLSCLVLAGCGQLPAPAGKEYERVVVISDLHYPSKTRDSPKRQAIMDNKAKAREDINSWQDVDLKVFTGDMVEMYGSMNQMEEAKQFIDGFAGEKLEKNLQVAFPEELLIALPADKREALLSALSQDPRPAYQQDGEQYGFEFSGFDVRFSVDGDTLTVFDVAPAGSQKLKQKSENR